MNSKFYIKAGDTRPAVRAELSCSAEDIIDSLTFTMVDAAGLVIVDAEAGAVVEQPSSTSGGVVQYQWASDETVEAGTYKAEFTVTFDDGRTETFPNTSYLSIYISERL